MAGASAAFFSLVFTLNMLYQATVVGLSPLQMVLVGTVLEAVVFVAEVPTGIVADVYSRRLSLLVGFALIGLGFVLEGAVPAFLAILGSQVLWGIGVTFTSGAQQAWITDEVGADKVGHIFTRATQIQLAGSFAGILGAGALGLLSVQVPIVAGGIGFLVLTGVLALTMPERGFQRSDERVTFARLAAQFRAGLALARRRPVVRTLMMISLIVGLASEAFDRLWVVHMLTLDFPGSWSVVVWIAAIGLIGTILSLVVSLVANRIFKVGLAKEHPTGLLAGLAGVQVAAVAVFALSGHFWLALAMLWVRQIAGILGEPVQAAWMNRNVESGVRATVLSFESQLNAVGQVAGGPPLGALGNVFSVRAALLGSALVYLPMVPLYATAKDGKTDPPA